MKTSYRRSTISILLSAFFILALGCHRLSALAQTKGKSYGERTALLISKIDVAVTKEFQEAWRLSRNGSDGSEGLVLVYPTRDGSILARSQGKSSEPRHFTFAWAANIIAVVHTHPNDVDPRPVGEDLRLADRFGVPVFTITRRGMYVYDPDSKKIDLVQEGLDWLNSINWNRDGRPVAQNK